MRNGELSRREPWERRTSALACGSLPTLTASEGEAYRRANYLGKQRGRESKTWEKTSVLTTRLIGRIFGLRGRESGPGCKCMVNPSFAEWFMGYPHGWTRLD